MFIPKLIFYYAYPFDAGRRKLFLQKGDFYPPHEEVSKKVNEYRTLWSEINADDKIMKSIVERTGVTLPRDLEAWIFGAGMNAMSSPFLVPAFSRDGQTFTEDKLIEIFIHEILHRFIGNPENNPGITHYWKAIRIEYAEEPILVQNHLLIYAFLEEILLEFFGEQKKVEMIDPKGPEYMRAFELAKEKGSAQLIQQFHSFLHKAE